MDYLKSDTTTLAFIGDAVYEQYIREYVIQKGIQKTDRLHAHAVRFVNAGSQAKVINILFEDLSEEEKKLVKRARNKKTNTKAKNADPIDYKWATAFEALIGYYKLSKKNDKLDNTIKRAINIIEDINKI